MDQAQPEPLGTHTTKDPSRGRSVSRIEPVAPSKRRVGASDDPLKRDADAVATRIMRLIGHADRATVTIPAVGEGRVQRVARAGAPVIQRWGEFGELRNTGWKYSGGSMATQSNLDPLWHASVFKVKADGSSAKTGLFYDGFHLTMEYQAAEKINPHVFFDSAGTYVPNATVTHPQTVKYVAAVGAKQWAFDLATAKALAPAALQTLGPQMSQDAARQIEVQKLEALAIKEDAEEAQARAAAQAELQRQAVAASAAAEEVHIGELLKDVQFNFGPYPGRFLSFVRGVDKSAIKDTKLKEVADWYIQVSTNRGGWIVDETPQAAYTGWAKDPKTVVWQNYPNSQHQTWRAKDPKTTFMTEYRMLKFNGYASYKTHPNARKPPAT